MRPDDFAKNDDVGNLGGEFRDGGIRYRGQATVRQSSHCSHCRLGGLLEQARDRGRGPGTLLLPVTKAIGRDM